MIAVLTRRIFARFIEEGWLACEQAFIHDARAKAYQEQGNAEEAQWQRNEADKIRRAYGQLPEQWIKPRDEDGAELRR